MYELWYTRTYGLCYMHMYCVCPYRNSVHWWSTYWTSWCSEWAFQSCHWRCIQPRIILGVYNYLKQSTMDGFAEYRVSLDTYLSQFLVQSGGPGLSCCVTLWAEHLLVPVNEVAVTEPDHLHTEAGEEGERLQTPSHSQFKINVTK